MIKIGDSTIPYNCGVLVAIARCRGFMRRPFGPRRGRAVAVEPRAEGAEREVASMARRPHAQPSPRRRHFREFGEGAADRRKITKKPRPWTVRRARRADGCAAQVERHVQVLHDEQFAEPPLRAGSVREASLLNLPSRPWASRTSCSEWWLHGERGDMAEKKIAWCGSPRPGRSMRLVAESLYGWRVVLFRISGEVATRIHWNAVESTQNLK